MCSAETMNVLWNLFQTQLQCLKGQREREADQVINADAAPQMAEFQSVKVLSHFGLSTNRSEF